MIIRSAFVLLLALSLVSCGNSADGGAPVEVDTVDLKEDSVRKEKVRKKEMLRIRNKMEKNNPATELPMTIDTSK